MILEEQKSSNKYEDTKRQVSSYINSIYLLYVDFLHNSSEANLEQLINRAKKIIPPTGFKKYHTLLVKELSDICSSRNTLSKDELDITLVDHIAERAQRAISSANRKLAVMYDFGTDFSDINKLESSLSLSATRSIKKNYITITRATVVPIGSFNYNLIENSFDCVSSAGYIQLKNQVLIVVNRSFKPLDVDLAESIEQSLARLEEQTNTSWMLVVNSGISLMNFKHCTAYWAMPQSDVDRLRNCCAKKRLLLSGWSLI